MTFRNAIAEAPDAVANAYQQGTQALGTYSDRVNCSDTRRLTGSVNLDAALASELPNENRWDFGIGLRQGNRELAIWIEIHPAYTSEVRTVLNKLHWLKQWLNVEAIALWRLTARGGQASFFWLATNGVHIRAGTPQARQLQMAGLSLPRRRIDLS